MSEEVREAAAETAAPAGVAAPPAEAKRPLNLTILVLVLFVLNGLGAMRSIAGREEVLRTIPGFTPLLLNLWIGGQVAGALGAVGLWLMQRWGLYLLALSWGLIAIVDVKQGATFHAIFVTGLFWLVVLFTRPVRDALK